MKNTLRIGGTVLVVFSLLLGLKALAASTDSATFSAASKSAVKSVITAPVSAKTVSAESALGSVTAIAPISYQPVSNLQAFSPAVLAEDVKAGNFGAHVGGGNYSFPGDLTVDGNNIHLFGLGGGDESIEFSYAGAILKQTDQGFRFTSGGNWSFDSNVGIGLTNPEATLHVYNSAGTTPFEVSSIPNHSEPMIKLKGYNSMDWMWIDSNAIDNIFIGVEAGLNTVGQPMAGRNDVFIGHQAGYSNMFATHNTAIGDKALYSAGLNYGQNYNVALGASAGYNNTGAGNVFLGYKAGYNETGSNKLYINNDDNGALIYGDFAGDKVGINTTNPDATLRVNGSMKANNYYSANGNVGISNTVKLRSTYNQPCTMTFENGLLTATTCPVQ